ncbi:signal peptidase II [Anaerosacchariphilus polymeriproducens]|uniref:Lipoprotein signal peptidase n=1 Tax=Anaerosacchariphilus polymeriproducens TaxID=1812858 RepID=A0A371ARE8_9FIRM|nr:signal peptidase II [Anaerosacchariphilus polymeriproducens]RDU22153.1 signal peptidase II [Anaerosacchariphilus polymeriproducens]
MIYLGIIFSIFILDFSIKKYMEEKKVLHKEEKICKGKIILHKYHNKGAIFNFLERNQFLVILGSILGVAVLAVNFGSNLLKRRKRVLKLGQSFMLGGALSNLYDRISKKYVVDYFSFNSRCSRLKNIIFNLSDIFIFLGGILVIIYRVFFILRKDFCKKD